MNKTHGSRKQDIEMFINAEILKGDIKRAIYICERYGISSRRFGKIVRAVKCVG